MKTNRRNKKRVAGFSLAELMVVIVIIGLLATAVVPKLMDRLADAKWGKVKADIAVIDSTLQQYMINNGRYPDTLEALVQPDANNRTYLDRSTVPEDPWGNQYMYEPPGGGSPDPIITCMGADGSPGGEGDDRDVTNIMIKNGEMN